MPTAQTLRGYTTDSSTVDLTAVDFYLHGVVTSEAAEESDHLIGNGGSRPDDDIDETFDTNVFIRVWGQKTQSYAKSC